MVGNKMATTPSKSRLRLSLSGVAILILILYKPVNYFIIGDALLSTEDPSFNPGPKSIFFHETSGRGLSIRQACSVEAAAKAHPEFDIYVLFSYPVTNYTLKTSCLAKLLEFPNVELLRVHIAEYAKGTAVQSILLNDLKESEYPIQHAADILRILTLNKWGGIYLDTDMIVTRSLENLPSNFVAKETDTEVATAVLSFAKDGIGANLTNEILRIIREDYFPTGWTTVGARAIEKALNKYCPKVIRSLSYENDPISNCNGITIFHYELFYPYLYDELDKIYSPPTKLFDLARPYTYHMWDFLSHDTPIREGSVYEIIARNYCPTIYNTYRDEFCAKDLSDSEESTYPDGSE